MNPQDNIFFSIIIPAYNEQDCIEKTCRSIINKFYDNSIHDYEIIVINDNSSDNTPTILAKLSAEYDYIKFVNNIPPNGFGFAVKKGLESFSGETVCIVMADMSDSPDDILKYYLALKNGAECVFGSRFIKGSKIIDYPKYKLVINRLANWFIKLLFGIEYNDITNAFKAYKREVIDGIKPILSHHFNITVEMPLKAIVRGYTFHKIPISWTNRETGISKLKLKEMGSRYLFIVLYVFLEKLLSKKDYYRNKNRTT